MIVLYISSHITLIYSTLHLMNKASSYIVRRYGVVGLLSFLTAAALAPSANAASFTGLGDLAGDLFGSGALGVSGDGSTVVGFGTDGNGGFGGKSGFVWTAGGGMVSLGANSRQANDASLDGSVVVGAGRVGIGSEAFRWTSGGGLTLIGNSSADASEAWGVNADGSVIAGFGGTSPSAWRWTSGTGLVALQAGTSNPGATPPIVGLDNPNSAKGVSNDGSVITGFGTNSTVPSFEPFIWTAADGAVSLGALDGTTSFGAPRGHAVSGDGTTIVGIAKSTLASSNPVAFRWTAATGMVSLGSLPTGVFFTSQALDVSGDGSMVVGHSNGSSERAAFIWDATNGMRDLKTFLEGAHGLDLTGWTLTSAEAISDDGMVIVGVGVSSNGQEAWMAIIPEPSTYAAWSGIFAFLTVVMVRCRRS